MIAEITHNAKSSIQSKIIFSSASVFLFFNLFFSFPREVSYSFFGIGEDLDGACSTEQLFSVAVLWQF